MPDLVFLVEHRVMRIDRRDPGRVDLVTKTVAHEVAHQWWGRELSPPTGPILSVELQRYLTGRAGHAEVPLARATNQGYLHYSKGALVSTALEHLIGKENVNRALAERLKRGTAPGASPRTTDLVDGLRAVTPAAYHRLLDDDRREASSSRGGPGAAGSP